MNTTGLINSTENRLSELPSAYGSDVKTMPGSMTNTKRNSIAQNILHAEKSGHGSAVKHKEQQRLARNSDSLRSKGH